MWTDKGRLCRARLALGGLLLSLLALAGPALQAADTEYYRHYDQACVEAMLAYAWTHLAPAVQARCNAAGLPWERHYGGTVFRSTLLSAGRWHAVRDTRFYTGPAGWSTADGTLGLRLGPVRFHDADGNGRRTPASEYVWLDADDDAELDAGEPVLGGTAGAPRLGDCGRVFPDRLYAADTNASGAWEPTEDIWQETAAADRTDLQALHAALTGVLGSYVNHLEEPTWNGGTTFARAWTTGMLLTVLGQETLLSPPAALDGSFAAARALEAWLGQAVGMVDVLQFLPLHGPATRVRTRCAFVCRGPYAELNCSWQESSPRGPGPTYHGVLTPQWYPPAIPQAMDPERTFTFRGHYDEETGYAPCLRETDAPGDPAGRTLYAFGPYSGWEGFLHTDGPTATPWYLGSYRYDYTALDNPVWLDGHWSGSASVTVASPSRNMFGVRHSPAPSGLGYAALTILPSSTPLASLLASEWAAAEWRTTVGARPTEVRAYRWESDTSGYWPDGHGSAIGQDWQDVTATLNLPTGAGAEIYVYITAKEGTPDLFAGLDSGRFWHWSSLPAGPGGPAEVPFAPASFPEVPDPVYPDGDYEATTQQSFTVHGLLDYREAAGFALLPPPPGVTPPPTVAGAYGPDSNRDDLVDLGLDLVSFGPDTGTMALQPEWAHPQVLIPLAVSLWDELPVHAYLGQGACPAGPNREWLHPDAGEQPFAFSLHTRAGVEELVVTPATQRKLVTVVRPRGNRVAFEFAWDPAVGAFAPLGFPLAPNHRRTYVLCDLTPADDQDASFELRFDSGVSHVYSGGRLAEGALTCVRHVDGRAVQINSLTDCSVDLNASTFASPRCRGVLTWSGGLLRHLDYTWRAGGGTVGVDLVYTATPAGAWVTALAKTIPELGVRHPGGFGFAAGPQQLSFGSGVSVTRDGGSLTTVSPSGGTLTQSTTFNADGLPIRIEISANGSSHGSDYVYAGGNDRYSANGAPAWAKLIATTFPDGSWERFEYDAASGWLSAHLVPFGDAGPDAPTALCRVTRFGYDHSLSAGTPADPNQLVERPRLELTETLGVETARTYHAYGSDGDRSSVLIRRCAAAGAAWDDPANLESLVFFSLRAPASVTTPTGWVRRMQAWLSEDRFTLFEAASSGQSVLRVYNALGQTLSYRCTEPSRDLPYGNVTSWFDALFFVYDPYPGLPLATAEASSGIDPFGRPVRTDTLDGTFELFEGLQWHGGPLRHTCSDGSVETCTYFPDGRLRSRTHYGVTTTFAYDALGNVVREQHTADTLSVQTRSQYDSQGRRTLFEDELGRRTVTIYRGPDCTVIAPDGSRRIEEHFLDGTLKHVYGDGVTEAQFSSGVDLEGT